jgi:hypothetical protein
VSAVGLGERSAAAVEKKFQKFKFKAGFETAEKKFLITSTPLRFYH